MSICRSIYLSIDRSVSLSSHPSFDLSLDVFMDLAMHRSVYLSIDLFTRLSIDLDFCWQHLKRSNSARLSHFLQLKTSKTKQFCETSFENGNLTVQLTASYQCVLRFFHAMSLKYCACHEKVSPGQTKCCTCHEKASWHS